MGKGKVKNFLSKNKGAVIGSAFGPLGTLIGGQSDKKKAAKRDIASKTASLEQRLQDRPTYEIPPEVAQLAELYKSTGSDIVSTGEEALGAAQQAVDLSEKATGVAEARTAVQEAPGAAIAREQVRGSTAGTVQNIVEAGGGGASSLGAIAQAGQGELNAMRDIAVQNQLFRNQAEQQFMGQLGAQASQTSQQAGQLTAQAGLIGQAGQLEGAGLQNTTQQKGLQFESELGKFQDITQYRIGELANTRAEEMARKNRNAQIASSAIGAVGGIGKTLATGGVG